MRPMIVYDSISIIRQLISNTHFQAVAIYVVMYIFRFITCITENTAINNYSYILSLLHTIINRSQVAILVNKIGFLFTIYRHRNFL